MTDLRASEINPSPEILRSQLIEVGDDLRRTQALVARLMRHAKGLTDAPGGTGELAKRIYTTIAVHNLGETWEPGGSADKYIIPAGS